MKKRVLVGLALLSLGSLPLLVMARNEVEAKAKPIKAKPILPGLGSQSMLPAACIAGTKIKDEKAPGGFATSDNLS